MLYVALLRNVNLGQPKSPTRAQLESAFLHAAASTAASFLSNGTLVFSVAPSQSAQETADHACEYLSRVCGLNEPAFTHSLHELAQFVAKDPFSGFDNVHVAERAATFFAPMAGKVVPTPIESARKDCLVFRVEAGVAFSVTWEVNGKIGYPTPVLEKALNQPATTRSWTTIVRLVRKYS